MKKHLASAIVPRCPPNSTTPGLPLRRIVLALFGCLLVRPVARCAANVAFIESPNESSSWHEQGELACRFYGLEVRKFVVGSPANQQEILRGLANHDTVGVIASAGALSRLKRTRILAALQRSEGSAPLMIAGIIGGTDSGFLRMWSADGILAGEGPVEVSSSGSYAIAGGAAIARQLSGQSIPLRGGSTHWLLLNQSRKPTLIISIATADDNLPIFVGQRIGKQDVFVLAEYRGPDAPDRANLYSVLQRIAPFLMFLRYAAGDMVWHSLHHYANLTIDDPWLTEPYGNLSYHGLLGEMQKHNFHTTIAFIPWNFNRSKATAASLIRKNLDRYSICIHGNNHNHQEFGDYAKTPLSNQRMAIEQAMARMERFKALNALPYDKVMVWPHEVVPPEPTLALLKQYNFLANVNADVVPIGAPKPDDPLFGLRSEHLGAANFPTIARLPVTGPGSNSWLSSAIAADAFLESPILFYAHQDLFASGIGAFDSTADVVNHIQPDTVWASLGEIGRHLFLVRKRRDGNYDVMTFSSQFNLTNPEAHDETFFVEKDESFVPPIRSLTAGGEPFSYERIGNRLSFHVTIPAEQSKEILMTYSTDLNLGLIDVSQSSVRISLLRRLSDFRDLQLARNKMGAAFVQFYYRHLSSKELNIEELFRSANMWAFVILVILSVASWRFLRARKARKDKDANPEHWPPRSWN